ncbi:ABC transporter ATP-binding protein [Candidatus Dependentiae bacterium]
MEHVLLKVQNLKKFYQVKDQRIKALDGVSFDIHKGEIIGLLGVNGAGKTTLSSILVTLHPPTSGDVLINGESIYKDVNAYRKLVGFCPQNPNIIKDLTVEQNLYFAGLYYGFSAKEVKQRMDNLIARYGLGKYRKMRPDVLSGGYMRRLLIARSLMNNPKLLILDEPTVGLDPNIRRKIWDNIRDLKKMGVTVILTTHYIDEAEILSDRIIVLDAGKIKLIDTPKNLMKDYQKSRLEDVFVQLIEEEAK